MNRFFRVRVRYHNMVKYYFFSTYEEVNIFTRDVEQIPNVVTDTIRYSKPTWAAEVAVDDLRGCIFSYDQENM